MKCYNCKEPLDNTIECADGHLHCEDCADDILVKCKTCGGGGSVMGVVRGWHQSPPEKTCGMCNGAGVIEYGVQERGVPTYEDIADMRADAKMDELRDRGGF